MPDVDTFARSYLFVNRHRPADAEAVAELLEDAAAKLRNIGQVDVHHIAFDIQDSHQSPTLTVTVYYDRIERRRQDRVDSQARHPVHEGDRPLRPVT